MADDGVYRERAILVAFVASLFPSVIAYSDPAEPDWPVIYVDGPAGQMSWHLHKDDLTLFGHVPVVPADDPRAQWDQHTTYEKYLRMAAMASRPGTVVEIKGMPVSIEEMVEISARWAGR